MTDWSLDRVALLAFATLVPVVVLALTSFVKLQVVLSAVRNALGAPELPSALVVTAAALILTAVVMGPTVGRVLARLDGPLAQAPAGAGAGATEVRSAEPLPDWVTKLPPEARVASTRAWFVLEPWREFMFAHARPADRQRAVVMAQSLGYAAPTEHDLNVVAPAFLISELTAAFRMAALLLIPFLLIDVLIAVGIAAVGVPALTPQTLALPLKLMLFVAVDGWNLLIQALIRGYT